MLGTTLAARTASAQETLFSATVTVVDNPGFAGSDSIGYYSFSQSPSTSFTHDDKTFHMNLLGIDRDGCGATQAELSVQGFFGNGRWGAHSKESWVLLLGSRQFSFAAAERSGGEVQWCLDSVDVPGWEDGDEIAVKLLSSASGASTDASLSGLGLSPGTLTPAFDAETTQYTATVENTVERVTVTVTVTAAAAAADSEATVAYFDANGAELADADGGSDGHQVDLTVGANTIEVEVTAADAVTVRTYTLAVTRQASTSGVVPTSTPPASETIFSGTLTVVANPSYASANAGSIGYWGFGGQGSLTPADWFTYNGTKFHMNFFGIDGRTGNCGGPGLMLTSLYGGWGASEESWTLHVGSRKFSFADANDRGGSSVRWCLDAGDDLGWEDGDEIAVKIVKSAPGVSTDATLSELAVSPGALTPAFDPETTQYTATVENTVERVTVTAAATDDSAATVAYLDANGAVLADADDNSDGHQVDLAAGSNTVKVEVTAQDAVTVRTYTLAVTRQASSSGGGVPTPAPPASETIFSGTLTVVANPRFTSSKGSIGYFSIANQGSLTPAKSFTYNGATFHLDYLGIDTGGCSVAELIIGSLSGGDWGDSEESWTLHLGSRQFSFADASQREGSAVEWCLDSADELGWEDGDEIAIKIVKSAPAVSTDATLSELALSPGALTPAFDPHTAQYTATVENAVDLVTVTAETADSAATVAYFDANGAELADADAGSDGHQVGLVAGANTIEVEVTAADAVTVLTYTLVVTVQAPLLTVDAVTGDDRVNIAERTAGFAITGMTGTESGVSVSVAIGSSSPLTTTSGSEGAWSVSVPANASWITGPGVLVTVSARKTGFPSQRPVTRSVAVDLEAPSASWTAPSSLQVGVAIGAMTPVTSDTDIVSWSATGLPSGLAIDETTGVIGGTPDTADENTASATVTVTDTSGNPADVSLVFPSVAKGDQVLSGFAYSAGTVEFGTGAPAPMAPTGAQGTLSYTAVPPAVCSVDETSGALTLAGAGSCVVTVTAASTGDYDEATATFTVTVDPGLVLTVAAIAGDDVVNIAEKASGFAIAGGTGTQSGVSVSVTIGSQSPLTTTSGSGGAWSVGVPANASSIAGTGVSVTVTAEKAGFESQRVVTRSVAVDLAAPSASWTAPASLQVGVAIDAMSPSTSDTDIASYSATGLPSGLAIDATAGVIGGTPDTAGENIATAAVTVTDTAGNAVEVSLAFPAVAKGDQVLSGFAYSTTMAYRFKYRYLEDADERLDSGVVVYGDVAALTLTEPTGARTTLSYSAAPSTVCSVDETTGAPTLVGAGLCEVTVTAASTADYHEATATATVTILPNLVLFVGETDSRPTQGMIAGDDVVNIAEKARGFRIKGATGEVGDHASTSGFAPGVSVSVTIGSQPPLTTTSGSTGKWSVRVPRHASWIAGTSVPVTVTAEKAGMPSPDPVTRTLAVDLAAPSVSWTAPASLQVGVAIDAMAPVTSDTDIASYSATGLPAGLVIDSGSGAISGTPDRADDEDTAGEDTASATVRVTDTAGNRTDVSIAFPPVDKADQVLSGFAYSADTVTFGDPAPTLTEPSGALSTLSYTATPSTVCSVEETTGALTLVGAGLCEVTATAASTDNYNEATATFTVTIQDTLLLAVDAIAGDGIVNIAEKASGLTISGHTGSTASPGSESGVSVSVHLWPAALDDEHEPLVATSDSAGAWSVSVPAAASWIAGTSVPVRVTAEKTFLLPVTVTHTLGVDLAVPSVSWTAPLSLQTRVAIDAMTPVTGATDIVSFRATGLPSGLAIDETTGVIGGTPDTPDENIATATVRVTDTAGNVGEVPIVFPVVQDLDLLLTVGTIAGDDVVNIAEKAAGFTISGSVSAGIAGRIVSQEGVSVSVAVGSQPPLSATSDSEGAWSVRVPAQASWIAGTSVPVTVRALKAGFASPSPMERRLGVDVSAPSVSWMSPVSLQVGEAIVSAMAPVTSDTDIVSYRATGLPSGLVIDSGSGAISGTPDTADEDVATATVAVTDIAGNAVDVSVAFPSVAKGDQVLSGFAYSPDTVTYGDPAPILTAPMGARGALVYSATPPAVCSVNAATGTLAPAGVGSCEVTVTAAATADYDEAAATFTVAVEGTLLLAVGAIAGDDMVNIAEKAAGFTISGFIGSATSLSVREADVLVRVRIGSQPPLTTISNSVGAWSVRVPAGASWIAGTGVPVRVTAEKTGFASAVAVVTRTLAVDLTAPSVSWTAPASLYWGERIRAMRPRTSDTDIASWRATGLPRALTIDGATGVIRGQPASFAPGAALAPATTATVTVTDIAGNAVEVPIAFPAVTRRSLEPEEDNPDPLAVMTDPITGDGWVNIAEKAAGFAITGRIGVPGEAGVSVSVKVGSQPPLSATTDSEGAWSVSVPAGASWVVETGRVPDGLPVRVTAEKAGLGSRTHLTELYIDLTAPSASWTAFSSMQVGVAIDAMRPRTSDTDLASYSATGLPSGLVFSARRLNTSNENEHVLGSYVLVGVIRGTPDTADEDIATATVTVTDKAGNAVDVPVAFPPVDKGEQVLSGFAYRPDTVGLRDPAPTLRRPRGAQGALSYTATPAEVCGVDETTGALTLVGAGLCEVTVTAASTDNYNEAAAATFAVSVQDRLLLTVDTIAGDDVVNIAEKTAGFAITGATGTESGVSVSVTVGSQQPLSATSDSAGAWSVRVPAQASWIAGTGVSVRVTAEKAGLVPAVAVPRTLAVDLAAPSVSWTAPVSLQVGVAIDALTPATSDTDIASYAATGLPSGLAIDGRTGVIRGTPDTAGEDVATATVTVTDIAGNAAEVPIALPAVQPLSELLLAVDAIAGDDMVNIAEKASGFAITGATGTESGASVSVFVLYRTDRVHYHTIHTTSGRDGAWSVSVPAQASWIAGTGVSVTVTAMKAGFASLRAVTRSVAVDLAAPSVSWTAPASLQVGVAMDAMTPVTSDTDIASYAATGLPSGLAIHGTTGVIGGTPDTTHENIATVTVTDVAGNAADVSVAFPEVDKGEQVLSGFAYSDPPALTLTAPMGARGPLSYTAAPSTVCRVDATTGALTPVGAGDCVVTVTAASTYNYDEATATFTVTVADDLLLTVGTIAGDDVVNIAEKAAGFAISGFTRSATSLSGIEPGVQVSVRIGSQPPLTTVSNRGGAWSVRVPAGASWIAGTGVPLRVTAQKTGFVLAVEATRTLALDLAAPSVSWTVPASLQAGVALDAMTPVTSDTDIASYSAADLPSGLEIDGTTGVIGGTPDNTVSVPPATATVTVTDSAGNAAEAPIAFPTIWTPELTVSLDAITGDNLVNIAEKASGFTVSGSVLSGIAGRTVPQAGVAITVYFIYRTDSVGGYGYETSFATSDGDGAWSVSVPAQASFITGTSVSVWAWADLSRFAWSKEDGPTPQVVTRALAVDLAAPSVSWTAPASLKVGVAAGALPPATSDADIASYGATGLPSGLAIDGTSGVIGGTPDTAGENTATATVVVTDSVGNAAEVSVAFPAVAKGEQVLSGFAYSADTVTLDDPAPTLKAPAGGRGGLSYTATPSTVCSVDETTGALALVDAGLCEVTVTAASTDNYDEATATFTVTVQDTLRLTVDAISGDDTVSIAEVASGFTISGHTGSTASPTGSESGVSVSVYLWPATLDDEYEPLVATSDSEGGWSVRVPAQAPWTVAGDVTVRVTAEKTGWLPVTVTRTLDVDHDEAQGPLDGAFVAAGGGGDRRRDAGRLHRLSPVHRVILIQRHGSAFGSGDRRQDGRDRRDAGHGRREHRDGDGDGDGHCRQPGRRVGCLPGGRQGRPGAERVRLQLGHGDVRRPGADIDGAHGGADDAVLHRGAFGGVQCGHRHG